jgi:hypothetical protein
MNPRPARLGTLVRALLGLSVLFGLAFLLTHGNANAGIFLFLLVVSLGLALLALFTGGLQRFGGRLMQQTGRSERDLLVGGLLLVALLTPWTVPIPQLGWRGAFGWQSPLALVAIGGLVVGHLRMPLRRRVMAVGLAGAAILALPVWLGAELRTGRFASSGFPFLPIDLLGEGWYLGSLAVAVVIDGLAAEASGDPRPASRGEVWPFSIVPGMGLVRLHYPGRGRLYLLGAALALLLLQATAILPEEFQYYAAQGGLPPSRPRSGTLIPLALLLLVWAASLLDTRKRLRWEALELVTSP